MNRPLRSVSRHHYLEKRLSSPTNLRLGALILAFIAINQLDDPLVDATMAQDLLYWCVRIGLLAGGFWIADALVSTVYANRWSDPAWLKPVVLVSVFALIPFSLGETLIEPYLPVKPEFVDDDLWNISPALAFLSEYATALSIYLPVHMLIWLVIEPKNNHTPAEDDTQQSSGQDRAQNLAENNASMPMPQFLERATVHEIESVYALQAEEHYVRVHHKQGSELIHYRFGDAVKTMPDALGMQVHRSWWVAESALQSAKKESRRWQLLLADNINVPVSDSYVKAVRNKGWLKKKNNPEASQYLTQGDRL